ncbi:tetratricopeptide repeat protein [Haloferula sp. BvORR071]|uniref:tetratricopeptide repeat protein n=1 Tax=Haloferula sp. BvORR071 TaxID=1396141 RepID=UPI000551718B|nr:tetratricopeptide repeat protein [Haloferula sp. BvORR071]
MRVAKTYVPSHVLGAFLLVATAGMVTAQQPKPVTPPAAPGQQQTMAPGMQAKLWDEAEKAFGTQDYATVTAKLTELIKGIGSAHPALEFLQFNLGLANLLAGNAAEAEKAFDEGAKKFPKGEYTSRCYLGIGKAAILQGGEEKQKAAIEAFKKAAADPKLRTEAGLALGQVYIETDKNSEALTVFRSLMGSDVRTPQQTAAAVEVIGLLAETDQLDDLVAYLDRLIGQPGIREAIAWYSNQVVVKGDAMVQAEKYEAALSIYRSVPPREEILRIQAASLEKARKDLDMLKARKAAEEKKMLGERSNNLGELISTEEAAIKLNTEAKEAIEKINDLDAALLMRRGRCYYYLERRAEALLCFSTIREKHPTATDAEKAAYAEIVLYNELKDNTKIQELTNQFMTKYPQAPNIEQVATLAGEVLVGTGDWPKVQSFYEDLAAKFPQSPNLDRFAFFQGVAKFQQGEFLPAAEMFEKFLKDYPNSTMKENAMYRIAMGYFLSNKYKETLKWCRDYLNAYPSGHYAGDMLYRLAFIDSNDKEVDQSKNIIDNLTGFLAKNPNDPAAGSMTTLIADTWKKKMSPPAGLDQKALDAWNKGNPPAAIKSYEDHALEAFLKAVWSDSPDDVIQYGMDSATTILQGRKDWQGIADLHGKFLKEKPDHQMAMMSANWVSKAMTRLGKPEEGAQVLADVMAKNIGNPDKVQVEYLITEIVKSMKPRKPTPELAKELDEKLTAMLTKAAEGKENPTTNARIYYGRAQLANMMRDPKTAEGYLSNIANDESIPVDAFSPELLATCADILLKEGKLDRAEEMYRRLADKYMDSTFSDAGPVGLGQVALARKEPQKAFELFENAINNLPGMSRLKEATFGKLEALRDLEKLPEAEALAMEIVGNSRSFRGRTVPKTYMVLCEILRKKARNQDTKTKVETLKSAHGYYQRVYTAYQKETDICAAAYMGAYEVATDLGNRDLATETLKQLRDNPRLKDTPEAKKAAQLLPP